jgi:hypothetical protein
MPELYLKKQMLSDASSELEAMRSCKDAGDNDIFQHKRFPSACLNLLYSIDGEYRNTAIITPCLVCSTVWIEE